MIDYLYMKFLNGYYMAKIDNELLEYVKLYADKYLYLEDIDPDTGEDIYYPEVESGWFVNWYDESKLPFSKSDFMNHRGITDTIAAFGLDKEKFWYVTAFFYYLTEKNCRNAPVWTESFLEQSEKFIECTGSADVEDLTLEVRIKGSKKLVIDNRILIKFIYDTLKTAITEDENGQNLLDARYCQFSKGQTKNHSMSVWINYIANCYIRLFELMNLPDKRARDSKEKVYEGKTVTSVVKKEKIVTYSYNKQFFISILVYFMGLTRNESFLKDENSLRGILKTYKNYKM